MILTKEEFKEGILSLGITKYKREVEDGVESACVYITSNQGLIGYWSPIAGGKIYKKPLSIWSPSYRKFKTYNLKDL